MIDETGETPVPEDRREKRAQALLDRAAEEAKPEIIADLDRQLILPDLDEQALRDEEREELDRTHSG